MTKEEIKAMKDRRNLEIYLRSLYGSNLTDTEIQERVLAAKSLIDKTKK